MNNILFDLDELVRSRPYLVVIGVIILVIPVVLFVVLGIRGSGFQRDAISEYSSAVRTDHSSFYSLNSEDGYLFRTGKSGREGVLEFLAENPEGPDGQKLFPEDFINNSELTRESHDRDDAFIVRANPEANSEHYVFIQEIQGIPLLGGEVFVHLRNGNEIYAVSANVSLADTITERRLSPSEAEERAVSEAGVDAGVVTQILEERIVNPRLLGISTDETNYRTLPILVSATPEDATVYYVDLESGSIVYQEAQFEEILNRDIKNCTGRVIQNGTSITNCPTGRSEGQPVVSDSAINDLYDLFGEIYGYYSTNFNRDSYDDRGSVIRVGAHIQLNSPNAFWDGQTGNMGFSDGLTQADVVGHEFTHGIVQYSAGLTYQAQSGAMNESIADIFGSALDGNWQIGESNTAGLPRPLRSMESPTSLGDPDRLFSSQYYCGGVQANGQVSCSSANDQCGLHSNSGVTNKMFYLMVEGGDFNGCSIGGIGRERAHAVIYQALTRYLSSTSNFKAMYQGVLQACNDLYASEAGVCDEVRRAAQAVEIDQQPDMLQGGARCIQQARQVPQCEGEDPNEIPTTTGIPTIPPTPTGSPGATTTPPPQEFSIFGVVFEDTDRDSIYTPGVDVPREGQVVTLAGDFQLSFTTLPNGAYVFDLFPGTFTVSYKTAMSGPIALSEAQPSVNLPIPVTVSQVNPTPTVIFGPTSIPTATPTTPEVPTVVPTDGGTGGSGGTSGRRPTVTPTPQSSARYECDFDPKCASDKGVIQLCPLVCTEVSGDDGVGGSATIPTSAPGAGATATPTSSAQRTGSTIVPTQSSTIAPTSATAANFATMVNSVSEGNIRSYMQNLVDDNDSSAVDETQTRYTGSQGLVVETQYALDTLNSFGVPTSFQNFTWEGVSGRNVIGRLTGEKANDVYLVTAHIDSITPPTDPAPGADDNGSGTVAVMEIARSLKAIESQLKSSVEFILFSGEEQGLKGSSYYASGVVSSGKNIKGVINLDMIGNSSGGDCVNFGYKNYNGGNVLSEAVLDANAKYSIGLGGASIATSDGRSDHKPFWDIGKPAVFGHECTFSPVYHSENDKTNAISYSQITKTAKAVAGAIADLATK